MGKEPSYVRTFSNNTALSSTSQGKILVPGTQTGCFFWVNGPVCGPGQRYERL